MSYLKSGKAVHDSFNKEEESRKRKMESSSSPYTNRFWMKTDDTKHITFLDGGLDEDGLLITVSYYEHQVKMDGNWRNWFVCVSESEPCPICEDDQKPSLVSLFTIIDHSEFTDREGNVRSNNRTLYPVKGESFKRLQKLASKRNGLMGCTFEVSRVGDKAPNVGSDFDFVEKIGYQELLDKYSLKKSGEVTDRKVARPYDYEKIIPYRNADELRALGFGGNVYSVGSEQVQQELSKPNDTFEDSDIPF